MKSLMYMLFAAGLLVSSAPTFAGETAESASKNAPPTAVTKGETTAKVMKKHQAKRHATEGSKAKTDSAN